MSSCRLCNKKKELKNSHVIPEFIYKSLYDEKHRFEMLSNLRTKGPAKLQKGIREYLLCEQCEVVLSRYERYVSLILSGQIHIKHERKGKLIYLEGVDYKMLRLFGLSVLWRASISSHQFFEQVRLGPHEEILRCMILEQNPGKPDIYPFMLSPVVHLDEVQTDLIMQPTWTRSEGHLGYRFVFGGLAWIYIVSSHRPPYVISQAAVSEGGCLTMLISDIENMTFIKRFVQELVGSENLYGN